MRFTLYTSNSKGNAKNAIYPKKQTITSEEEMMDAVSWDHVTAEFVNSRRSLENFLCSDVEVLDCDNDHSENPDDWMTPEKYKILFPGVSLVVVPSRNDGKAKGNKSPRPRHHVYVPHAPFKTAQESAELKQRIFTYASFFDEGALDAARFIFGHTTGEILWIEGEKTIDEFLEEREFEDFDRESEQIQEGSRNRSMSLLAGKLIKRYGDTEEARAIFMERSEQCCPPLEQKELDQIWWSARKFGKRVKKQEGYISPKEYNKPEEWEVPIPFDDFNLPEFPVDTLPNAIGDYVVALAESTQTPVDMAATSAIAVLSVCMQGKYKIRAKPDWIEPVNTFVLDVMEPSERKSAVENAMIRPLNLFEAEMNLRNAGAIETSRMQKRILERKQKAIEDQVAKGKLKGEEVQQIADEVANFKELKPLKLYVDDITTEKLTSVLAANDGKAAILSTEGGIFDTLAGAYSRTVNIDVMLKGYSGDSIRVDRIGRNSESIMNPALTVLLMVQPSVLSGLMQNGTFRGRGLTARFLYCIPKSFVGRRKYRSKSVPDEVYHAYEMRIRNLLEDECAEQAEIIVLSEEADLMLEHFAEDLEPRLKKEYEEIGDWAGKLVGNVLRISALLCRASIMRSQEFLAVNETLIVDVETMVNAIRIGGYFVEHAKAAFMLMGADPLIRPCERVIKVIKDKKLECFTRRDLMRYCRTFKSAEEVQLVINRLSDFGYLQEKQDKGYQGKGRPRSQSYLVNPHLLEP